MKKAIVLFLLLTSATFLMNAQKRLPLRGEINAGVNIYSNTHYAGKPGLLLEGICFVEANEYFNIGAGMNLCFYGIIESPWIMPLFFHFKTILPREKVSPYLACNIGYGLKFSGDTDGGFYIDPSIGWQIRMSPKTRLNLGIGVTVQNLSFEGSRIDLAMLSLRTGIIF